MNPYRLTADEQREWHYRVTERLGILCADMEPTQEQVEIAQSEADAWLREQRGELL